MYNGGVYVFYISWKRFTELNYTCVSNFKSLDDHHFGPVQTLINISLVKTCKIYCKTYIIEYLKQYKEK